MGALAYMGVGFLIVALCAAVLLAVGAIFDPIGRWIETTPGRDDRRNTTGGIGEGDRQPRREPLRESHNTPRPGSLNERGAK